MSFLVVIVFCLAGFSLKMADLLGERDGGVKAFFVSGVSATLFWFLLKANNESSTIILSIVVGCLLTLKVDKPNLVFGLGVLVFLAFLLGFCPPIFWLLILLLVLTVLDEVTHEKLKNPFFRFRGFLKVAVVVLAVLGFLGYLNALGFILFDLAYDLTSVWLGKEKMGG